MTERTVDVPLSGAQRALAEEWLASGRPAVAARPAATVMLVRDRPADAPHGDDAPSGDDGRRGAGGGDRRGGVQVFVQRRVRSMAFAPAMYVFPGGAVDDADAGLPLGTPGLAALAAAMGVSVADAAPRAAAAVREVAEECGVVVSVADLRARGHWVTPEFEPRRFDTWILAARMPPGQVAHTASGESDASEWVRPGDLLARHAAGEAPMLPPTVVSLGWLEAFGTVEAFLADRPRVIPVLPQLVIADDSTPTLRTTLS
ncbi:MAG: NUDIX hydrolase [Phycicoccus sp.]